MSLYKYFPSKDDLIVAFLRKRDEDFRIWFVGQVNGKAENPKDKLLAVFDVLSEWMDIPEFRGCAFINAVQPPNSRLRAILYIRCQQSSMINFELILPTWRDSAVQNSLNAWLCSLACLSKALLFRNK